MDRARRLSVPPARGYGQAVPRGRPAVISEKLPLFTADPTSDDPLYAQVAAHLRRVVEDGLLISGDKLDGEIGLAERWGISRQTMRRATGELVEQGILLRKHGVGTQVAPRPGWRSTGVRSLYDEMQAAGKQPTTVVKSFVVLAPHPDVAQALELGPGQKVYDIKRLRLVDGEPLALMRNWIPEGRVDLSPEALQLHGLYQLLRELGIEMRIARQSVGADLAVRADARLLGLKVGAPVLSVETVTYDDLGRPVEMGRHIYRGDTFRFQITNVDR